MKINKDREIIKEDNERRLAITLDTINLFVSLAVIIISLISLGMEDSPKITKRLIFALMAFSAAINVVRFYHERPRISAMCLLTAAALAVLTFMI